MKTFLSLLFDNCIKLITISVLFIIVLSLIFSNLDASVTYNPKTNTYTVDKDGCVKNGKEKPKPRKKKNNM